MRQLLGHSSIVLTFEKMELMAKILTFPIKPVELIIRSFIAMQFDDYDDRKIEYVEEDELTEEYFECRKGGRYIID